jgi:hypothetical protein
MRLIMIALVCSLTACASPDQRAEQLAADIKENYGPVCEKLGYEKDSEKYRDCMVSLFNADTIRAGAAAARLRRW